jgi:hypothetical protein
MPEPTPGAASSPPAATPPVGDAPRPGYRIERDPLGSLEVPEDAYWGVQTQRSIHNFPISGRPAKPWSAASRRRRANHDSRLPDLYSGHRPG